MVRKLTSQVAQQLLADVDERVSFYVSDEITIRNLSELYDVLVSMSDEQFAHYRNNEKNDFYQWVYNIINDKMLANELARAKSKQTTLKRIKARVAFLRGVANK